MAVFTVEKLASLCKVDQETIRRWRNRGVNRSGSKSTVEPTKWGHTTVKKILTLHEIQRGVALMFQDDAVRTFMQANPKYMTKELDRILNGDFEPALGAASVPEAPKGLENSGYVRQILEKQREDLLGKLREIDRALEQMK